MARRRRFRLLRLLGFVACFPVGLVLGLVVFSFLVYVGAVPNPFAPKLGGDVALAASDRPGLRVLFIGNSQTYENSMPSMVRALAAGDPDAAPIFAVQYVAGGWTLSDWAQDSGVAELLRRRWDVVVLQEQSRIPSEWGPRRREFLPAAQTFMRGSGPAARGRCS